MHFSAKEDYLRLLEQLIEPLRDRYTPLCAGLDIGNTGAWYDRRTILMEGFSRVLWGLVPMWKGGGTILDGFDMLYRQGLCAGTDPESVEYWRGFHDRDQYFVEMAAISFGLLLTPDRLWNPLSDTEKDRLSSWLENINTYELCDSNWQLFGVLTNIALKKLGRNYSAEKLAQSLEKVEQYYSGNGWYTDGPEGKTDYYISFAIHFDCLLYAVFMEQEDPERCILYKQRAVLFAQEFIYWFSEDGSALPYGRSLTYRFAQCAFWSACLFAGIEPFPLGVMKGIIARHFADWFACPITDNSGVLTIGYKYPNLHMAEAYNAPGSPYWALKSFIFLALPDDHPFWSAPLLPLSTLEPAKTLKNANMVITRDAAHTCAYPAGINDPSVPHHMEAKYAKFAYSTAFGFSVPYSAVSLSEAAPDSMLAFVLDGLVFVRRRCINCRIEDDCVYSVWSPFSGITVETALIPQQNGHIRRHTIHSDYNCTAYDCGFAVAAKADGTADIHTANGYAQAANGKQLCTVSGKGMGEMIYASPNTNLIVPNTMIPAVRYTVPQGMTIIETTVAVKLLK